MTAFEITFYADSFDLILCKMINFGVIDKITTSSIANSSTNDTHITSKQQFYIGINEEQHSNDYYWPCLDLARGVCFYQEKWMRMIYNYR